ncbi:MAG: S-layer homology domain-containing protein [Chloroflexota bacterium]|nr:S-layer homology domain-containing protein [Chloroflexota bacterium]
MDHPKLLPRLRSLLYLFALVACSIFVFTITPTTSSAQASSTPTVSPTPSQTVSPTEAPTESATQSATASLTPSATASATPTTCVPAWELAPPDYSGGLGSMNGVSAWTQDDAWAVGSVWNGNNGMVDVIDHWDGSRWGPGGSLHSLGGTKETFNLSDVTAVGPGEMWAVGSYSSETNQRGLLVHCKLGEGCLIAPRIGAYFTALSAASANDIWAVGTDHWQSGGKSMIGHYDGTAWSLVPAPDPRILTAIDARAADDVWAVGEGGLIARWDGSKWSVVPGVPGSNVGLSDVVALDVDDAWIVGSIDGQPAIEHWNGEEWTLVPGPDPGPASYGLGEIDAVSPNDIWVIGSSYDHSQGSQEILTLHWNGVEWSVVPNPGDGSPHEEAGMLLSVAAPAHDYVLAVGTRFDKGFWRAWTGEVYRNPCQTVMCTIRFADAGPGTPFYEYVRCLACRDVLSGYSGAANCPNGSPCFRPNDNITRGQIAKIVSNAAGYSDAIPEDQQSFKDVPSSSPFWLYIERVRAHGAISGYPCGGAGEPCPGTYYRPGANLTRGQLAKISTSVAGYNETPSGQTFNDVPPAQPFYVYIERAVIHNIISGYGCGAVGEPCPGAYFRPGVNVTRGQAAKIVAGTFFPDCQTPARK